MRALRAQQAVLRKGDELQVEIRAHALADVDERVDGEEPRIADVDMRADREEALAHRPVAIGERPLDERLRGQRRLELAPERDALEQRSRLR